MSGRDCSFASQTPPVILSTPPASLEHPLSLSDIHNNCDVSLDVTSQTTSPASHYSAECPGINKEQDLTLDEAVNLSHMELLIHALDKEMFNLGDPIDDSGLLANFLKIGLKSPYLLHALLGFSARHLAFKHPERSASYLHQAMALQTRAVSLFNATWTEVDESNCVAILLFSTTIGHHLLADTLLRRDPGGLDAFLTHYIQCVEMHRGMYIIASTAWPLLMQSDLEPILSLSVGFTSRQPKGTHCDPIREMIDSASGLREKDKEACRLAVQYLQVGFDAALAGEEHSHRYQMIFSWTMLAPPELTELLKAKNPEALVLLAYYALLLHYGRSMWQVGDVGAYIFNMITDYLSPEWDRWLEYPGHEMSKGGE